MISLFCRMIADNILQVNGYGVMPWQAQVLLFPGHHISAMVHFTGSSWIFPLVYAAIALIEQRRHFIK